MSKGRWVFNKKWMMMAFAFLSLNRHSYGQDLILLYLYYNKRIREKRKSIVNISQWIINEHSLLRCTFINDFFSIDVEIYIKWLRLIDQQTILFYTTCHARTKRRKIHKQRKILFEINQKKQGKTQSAIWQIIHSLIRSLSINPKKNIDTGIDNGNHYFPIHIHNMTGTIIVSW